MNERPNVVILTARCRMNRQTFGVRFEEKLPEKWIADWAFALKEERARREGYDQTKMTGGFAFDSDYPGCPHCYARRLVKCSCGQVMCFDPRGRDETLVCPWCGKTGRVTGTATQVDVSRDR